MLTAFINKYLRKTVATSGETRIVWLQRRGSGSLASSLSSMISKKQAHVADVTPRRNCGMLRRHWELAAPATSLSVGLLIIRQILSIRSCCCDSQLLISFSFKGSAHVSPHPVFGNAVLFSFLCYFFETFLFLLNWYNLYKNLPLCSVLQVLLYVHVYLWGTEKLKSLHRGTQKGVEAEPKFFNPSFLTWSQPSITFCCLSSITITISIISALFIMCPCFSSNVSFNPHSRSTIPILPARRLRCRQIK